MSKAYLLVICLFCASLSGCITDDELEDKSPTTEDDDTIEPVGTGNNETDDYDELIAEIQNLTNEIEELRLEIEEMKSSRYDAPENSIIELRSANSYWRGDEDNWTIEYTPWLNVTKNGNTVIIEYVRGDSPNDVISGSCTNSNPYFQFLNVDGVQIAGIYGGAHSWLERGFEITNECEWEDNTDMTEYWTTVTFTFPEEPVRMYLSDYESYTFE